MSSLRVLLALTLLPLASGAAEPSSGTSAYQPLRPLSACLDPTRVRSWNDIDSTTLLVDAGRRKFRLELTTACPELSFDHTILLVGDSVSGRICGTIGESVVARGRSCRIARVIPIDAETYERMSSGKHKREARPAQAESPPA